MSKQIATCWVFASSSKPDTFYQALQYTDGSTSCECRGWTQRCVNGVRSCRHTRSIEAGTADQECVRRVRPVYAPVAVTIPARRANTKQPTKQPAFDVDATRPARRFELE